MTKLKRLGIVVGVVLAGGVVVYFVEATQMVSGMVCFLLGFPLVFLFGSIASEGTGDYLADFGIACVRTGTVVWLLLGFVGAALYILSNRENRNVT